MAFGRYNLQRYAALKSIGSVVKQSLMPLLCGTLPVAAWHKLVAVNLVIPHWHIISDEMRPHVSGLYKYRNVKQFMADIEFFLKFYEPVCLGDIMSYLDCRKELPKRCFLPTFDDGFREIYEVVAPILYSKGISGAFFLTSATIDNQELCYPQKKGLIISRITALNSRTVEKAVRKVLDDFFISGENLLSRVRNIYYSQRGVLEHLGAILDCDFGEYLHTVKPYLSGEQVRSLLRRGFGIGAHSIDHPLYSELNIEEQVFQTVESVKRLSEMFEYACESFAFPYGDSDISDELFQNVFAHKQVKVSFGLGSIVRSKFCRNLPRFSMERTDIPARHILGRQFGRALLR